MNTRVGLCQLSLKTLASCSLINLKVYRVSLMPLLAAGMATYKSKRPAEAVTFGVTLITKVQN